MLRATTAWGGIAALLLLSYSCGGETPSVDAPSDQGIPGSATQQPFGTFQVALVAPRGETPGFTSVLGKVYDGPTPPAIIWEEAASGGGCRLLTPRVPFCEEPCGSGTICVEDGRCQPYPSPITVGTVQANGLRTDAGANTFSMDPIANNYQPTGGIRLPHPAFFEGDDITFSASGTASVAPFTMTAKAIGPLEVADKTLTLDGGPMTLEWTPAQQPELAPISAAFDISYHGGTKGKIECESPDTGSLQVSASLLDQLKALGVSGFPKVEITRKAIGTTDPSVETELVIQSMITKILEIPGVISCNEDADCPEEQACQPDFRCR